MIDIIGNRTLRDLLVEQGERFRDQPCLLHEDPAGNVEELTYGQLLSSVKAAAAGFSSIGIGKGDAVVVHLPNCSEFLVAWFALGWIGAVMVPSNTLNTAAELEYIIGHSEAVGILTSPPYEPTFHQVLATTSVKNVILARTDQPAPGTTLWRDLLATGADPPDVQVETEDVLEMIFTSGTTAKPKAVVLTHANHLVSGLREAAAVGIDETDRCLTSLPLFHVNGQCVTALAALSVGASIVLLEEFRATTFWRQVQRHQATALSLVAMQVRTLVAQPRQSAEGEHHVRRVFFAINVLDSEKEEFEDRFRVEFINGYGLSEAMVLVTAAPVHGSKRWPSIGLPVFGRQVRILKDDGSDAKVGEVGEIVVHGVPGRTLMKEYYRDPEATAAVLRDGWLHTGDNGWMDEKGYLYFFDRKKDVIKRAGENVSASEVESALLLHPQVAEAAVIGIPDPIRDEAVKAFVVAAPGETLTIDDLLDHCRSRLAKFKVPSVIELRSSLPKTSVGKIEKKALRAEQPGPGTNERGSN